MTSSLHRCSAPAAALFDMDGVLVDSNPFHFEAWAQLSRMHGHEHTDEELQYGLSGRKSEDILRYLFGEDRCGEELHRLALEKEALFREKIRSRVRPIPGLPALLKEMDQAGWRCSVATSAPRLNMELILDELQLLSFFAAEVTAEDVTVGKPHPQVYQLAAERAGVEPERCIVFEDAVAGIEAGRRAGMICIGLSTSCAPEALKAAGADLVVPDFHALTVARLQDLLDRKTPAV